MNITTDKITNPAMDMISRQVFQDLQDLFRYEVFKMLKVEVTDAVIENMLSWRHSGFNVYCGPAICPMMKTPWRIWPITSFVRHSHRNE